jgi:hypothetical protein
LRLDIDPLASPDMPAPVSSSTRPCACSCHDRYADDDPTEPGSYPEGCKP